LEESLSRPNLKAHRLSPALAALGEPGAHGFRQAPGLNAKARFHETFCKGKRVVEFGLAGEITHTKIIEPIKGTWFAPISHNDIYAQLLSEHETSIA
jgi:hypothetical protein